MHSLLSTLRHRPQIAPVRFLAAHPGCWIQYYDDTPAKNPEKAFSTPRFDPATARRKQQERCAICFSLQAFGAARTKEALLCFRNLGVDIDLLSATEKPHLPPAEIDRRKGEYLERVLLPFSLKPHWLIETRHGFHAVFRIQPQRDDEGIRAAAAVNLRLVRALGGDENAALLTQVLRVPGTLQFKDPEHPFLCLLLLDNASTIPPYDLASVRSVLDARQVFGTPRDQQEQQVSGELLRRWGGAQEGVAEGQRNTTAASLVGAILRRIPEDLWEMAGWGGLKEWNLRNQPPLPERELRSVYESIARRERAGRRGKDTGDLSSGMRERSPHPSC